MLTVPARSCLPTAARPLVRARGDVPAEAVLVVVGHAHGVVVAVERDDDEHGAEDLLAGDGHVVGDVGEERRLHEPALVELLGTTAAGDDARTLFLALLDVAEHTLALLRAHERAHEVAHVVGVAVGEVLEAGRRDLDRLVVDLAVDEHARRPSRSPGRRAPRPCTPCPSSPRGRRRRARCRPTCRRARGRGASSCRAALLEDALAGDGGTGERDEVDERARSVSSSPTRWSDDVTTWNTPGGMSVFSATRRPMRVAFHGVSGAGLRITVLPVARPWPIFCDDTSNG